ncbi:MAG: hypothetical protein ABL921_06290 [Pirellula sp.]
MNSTPDAVLLFTRSWLSPICFCTLLLISSSYANDDPPSAVGPVMKLFQSGRVPAERLGTVVEMICSRGNEHDLRVVFDELLKPDGFSRDLKMKVTAWLTDAATTRKTKPSGSLSSMAQLLEDKDAQQQLLAVRLASAWQVPSVADSIESIATNDNSASDLRQAAISGLVAILGKGSLKTLLELSNKQHSIDTRTQAVTALTTLDIQMACQQAAIVLLDAKRTDNVQEMLTAILNQQNGSDQLANALDGKKPSDDVAKMALRFMYSIGRSDSALSNVLSLAAGVASDPPPPTQEDVAKLVEQVIAHGNAARGEQVFRRAELSCFKCHSIHRAGGQVGPDLSAIGVSSPVDYVINSILNPNLAVKEQYVNTIFLMEDGKLLSGVIVDRDDNRVLIRDSQGQTIKIATADIEDEKEGKSQMPQGLTKFLTQDEVIDLAKFISELGKPGPFAPSKIPNVQRWRVLKDPPAELTSEVPHLEHIRQLVLNSIQENWNSAFAMVSGFLPLNELRIKDEPTVAILQSEVQINTAGKVLFQVECTEKFQIWLNDQPQDSRPHFDSTLDVGRHKVLVRVEISNAVSPTLKMSVAKPQDSNVQFELVGGP